jgi:two-component system, chemotaxis family, protein-glutamate methylesterase/glutaminase
MIIRVLLVEDSPVVLTILKRMLGSCGELEVVGTARSGQAALELIPKVQPRVICTDLQMPGMDGLEFIEQVMANYPRPILVLSAVVRSDDSQNVFRLLKAGALDVLPKPLAGITADSDSLKQELIAKIKLLSGVVVFTLRPSARIGSDRAKFPSSKMLPNSETNTLKTSALHSSRFKILGIGASTGGPQALHTILTQLPAHFPIPIICIQHISPGFLAGLVRWLAGECKLPVQIAQSGQVPQAGRVYFPPENHHLQFDSGGRFLCLKTSHYCGHRPSVTVTFESIARVYGAASIGVLLTGMGNDGAVGMQAIEQAGGLTIAQDEASSAVFGMPKEAIRLGAVDRVLSIETIPKFIQHNDC